MKNAELSLHREEFKHFVVFADYASEKIIIHLKRKRKRIECLMEEYDEFDGGYV